MLAASTAFATAWACMLTRMACVKRVALRSTLACACSNTGASPIAPSAETGLSRIALNCLKQNVANWILPTAQIVSKRQNGAEAALHWW